VKQQNAEQLRAAIARAAEDSHPNFALFGHLLIYCNQPRLSGVCTFPTLESRNEA
jgi:hypothetical protein